MLKSVLTYGKTWSNKPFYVYIIYLQWYNIVTNKPHAKANQPLKEKMKFLCQSAARLYAVTNTIFFLIRITLKSNKQILIKGKADQPADVAVSAHPRI